MGDSNSHPTHPVTVRRRYPDAPLVGVATAVFNDVGQILLVKRGRPPGAGNWGLPGGLLDLGERLADGARREVKEECAVEVELVEMIATFEPIMLDEEGKIEYHYVVVDFWGHYLSGEATPDDDAIAVAWVHMDDLNGYYMATDTKGVVLKAYDAWFRFQENAFLRDSKQQSPGNQHDQ